MAEPHPSRSALLALTVAAIVFAPAATPVTARAATAATSGSVTSLARVWRAAAPAPDALVTTSGTHVVAVAKGGSVTSYPAAPGECGDAPCPAEWSATWSATSPSRAVLVGGIVYVGGDHGVAAFDAAGASGCAGTPTVCAPLWTAPTDPVVTEPTVTAGTLYVGTRTGALVAFDARGADCPLGRCAPKWSVDLGSPITHPVAVSGAAIGVVTQDSRLRTIDASTAAACATVECATRWVAATDEPIVGDPVGGSGRIFVTTAGGRLLAFDVAAGPGCQGTPPTCRPAWSADARAATDPGLGGGSVLVGTVDGTLAAYNATGAGCAPTDPACAPSWIATLGARPGSAPTISGGLAYVTTAGGRLVAVDVAGQAGCTSGRCRPLWATTFAAPISGAVSVRGGLAAVATRDAVISALRVVATSTDPDLRMRPLTTQYADTFGVAHEADGLTVRATGTNVDGNTRITVTSTAPSSVDQWACATFTNESSWRDQEGIALRVRAVGGGGTRAITVTKNIFAGVTWAFNVHVWDTNAHSLGTQIGGFVLDRVFDPGGMVPGFPWRMCAAAIGRTVTFMVWPSRDPQPAWGDPDYGGTVQLPSGFDQPGRAGWYVGHLHAGEQVTYASVTTASSS